MPSGVKRALLLVHSRQTQGLRAALQTAALLSRVQGVVGCTRAPSRWRQRPGHRVRLSRGHHPPPAGHPQPCPTLQACLRLSRVYHSPNIYLYSREGGSSQGGEEAMAAIALASISDADDGWLAQPV